VAFPLMHRTEQISGWSRGFATNPMDEGNLPKRLEHLSRTMARVLRHSGPIGPDGWCPLSDLMKVSEMAGWPKEDIVMVVKESFSKNRPRFELKDEDCKPGTLIRATHKHSCRITGQQRFPPRVVPPRFQGRNNHTATVTREAASSGYPASVTDPARTTERLSPPPVQNFAMSQRQSAHTAAHIAEENVPQQQQHQQQLPNEPVAPAKVVGKQEEDDPFFNGKDPWAKPPHVQARQMPSTVVPCQSDSRLNQAPQQRSRTALSTAGAGSGPPGSTTAAATAQPPSFPAAASKPKPPAPPGGGRELNEEVLAKALQAVKESSSRINDEHGVNHDPVGNCSNLAAYPSEVKSKPKPPQLNPPQLSRLAEVASPGKEVRSSTGSATLEFPLSPSVACSKPKPPAPPPGPPPKEALARKTLADATLASIAALESRTAVPSGVNGASSWDTSNAKGDLGNASSQPTTLQQHQQQHQQQQQQTPVLSEGLLPDHSAPASRSDDATSSTVDGHNHDNVSSSLAAPVADAVVDDAVNGVSECVQKASSGSGGCRVESNTGRVWEQYSIPNGGGYWWSTLDSSSWFREDSPQTWVKYQDPHSEKVYWHDEETKEWFFIM